MLPIPIGTDRAQRQFPWMNYLLIAANVGFYAFSHRSVPTAVLGGGAAAGLAPGWEKFLLTPADPHLFQFISYQFLHANLSHIFFNMLFLYVFGNNLNEKLGNVGYLAFYLTGGILAGCGQLLTSTAPTLGASGAISAVTGLYFMLLPRTNIRIFWFFIGLWEVPSMYVILFSLIKDVLEPILWGSDGTAYAAHVTGTISGFIIGLLLLLTHLVQRDHYDILAMIDRYRRRQQYHALVASGYEPFSTAAPPAAMLRPKNAPLPPPPDPRIERLRTEIADLIHAHNLPPAAQKYLELRQIDPTNVLPSQDQLDVANQLMLESRHADAAAAYEDYLRVNTGLHNLDQIQLILGLIYARYLPNPPRAAELLRSALTKLIDPAQRNLAQSELANLPSAPPPTS